MRTYSLIELFNLTRAELFALHSVIVAELAGITDAGQRDLALGNLRLIRCALARRRPSP
jgi:hypothetical protein